MKITRCGVLVVLLVASIAGWLILLALQRYYAEQENYSEIEPKANRTRIRPPGEERDYSVIEGGLYMGGDVWEPPPGTTAVLNLCEQEDAYRCEVHVWEPIRDAAPAPSIAWLTKQVEF